MRWAQFYEKFIDGASVSTAAELRRLHAENEQLRAERITRMTQNDRMAEHIARLEAAQEPSPASNADGVRVLLPTQTLRSPECWCECCDTMANNGWRSRMSLCPQCGDKRCQRAYHHDSGCFASPKEAAP